MGLRFIYGGSGSGKSHFCLQSIKKHIEEDDGKKLIYLVPEQFSFQAEKNLLYVAGERAALRAEVLSFKRMAHRVLNEVGGITRRHISPSGRNMLIYKILEEKKELLKIFKGASGKQGFVDDISSAITEFKRYDISPILLINIINNLEEDSPLKDKLQDINLVYQEFENRIADKYIDPEDDLTLLCDKLDVFKEFDGAEFWVDEFSTFTPQQYKIIEKILKKADRVNLSLTTNCLNGDCMSIDDTDVFAPIKNTEKKLLKILQENNISYEKPIEINRRPFFRFRDSAELQHLEEYLFSFPYKAYRKETNDIGIFIAANPFSEVEEAAKDIIRLCREEGARFSDIAVVTRDLERYENIVKVIFDEYGISYFIDRKRDIEANPLVMLINFVIEIFAKGWSYEAVFGYLKTGLVDIDSEEVHLIENYVLANGIRGKRWTEDKDWNYRFNYGFDGEEMDELEAERVRKVNEIKLKIKKPLMKLQEGIRKRKNVKDICAAIYEFIIDIGTFERLQNWVNEFRDNGEQETASQYSQIWNTIIELLDQIVDVLGDEKMPLEDFISIFKEGIKQCKVGLIPPTLDQVLVSSIERIKSHDVKMVYILGVNDGVFPKISDDEGILSDRDRGKLKEIGIEIAADSRTQAFEEQFLIYTSLTIAEKYLKLSFLAADGDGKTMRPSIIISRLKKIFPNIKEESDLIKTESDEAVLKQVSRPIPTFNDMVTAFKSAQEKKSMNEIWKDVYRWYLGENDWKDKCTKALDSLEYTNMVTLVSEEKAHKLYGSPLMFSVSRLEKYAECPFAYYIKYGLNAKNRKVYELSMPDIGTFMHNVLDEFSSELERQKLTFREVEAKWCEDVVSDIVEQDVKKKTGFILDSSPRYRYMAKRLKRLISKSVWVISEHVKSGNFNPVAHEMEFGKGGEFPPIAMELSNGEKVNFIGRVDRVDEMVTDEGTYIRIIDYKSGSKEFSLSDVYYGIQLQLLVYLDAILYNWEKYEKEKAYPGAVLYFKIDDPIVSGKGEISEDQLQKEIMKKLKMHGLLLKDARIIKEMDKGIQGYSLIIPAQIKSDGTIGSNTSAATKEQFELLREYVKALSISLCEDMIKGNIAIMPCKKKNYVSCDYCDYSAICGFDSSFSDNKYRVLSDKDDETILELMKKKVYGNGDEA